MITKSLFSDYAWDTKQPNGMNVVENKFYDAMIKLGLNPEPQYVISKMTVDFAFPDKKMVIEVNGDYHNSKFQRSRDFKRRMWLKVLGWKIFYYNSDTVYDNTMGIAKIIQKNINKISNKSLMGYIKENGNQKLVIEF